MESKVFELSSLMQASYLFALYDDEEKLETMKKMLKNQPSAVSLIASVFERLKREDDKHTMYTLMSVLWLAFKLNDGEMPTLPHKHVDHSFAAHFKRTNYYNDTPHADGKEPDRLDLLAEDYPRRDVMEFVELWMSEKPEDHDDPEKLKEARLSSEVVFSVMKVIMDAYIVNQANPIVADDAPASEAVDDKE